MVTTYYIDWHIIICDAFVIYIYLNFLGYVHLKLFDQVIETTLQFLKIHECLIFKIETNQVF